jgi:predicted  nucleic acid-binding Zn-ribbon protein
MSETRTDARGNLERERQARRAAEALAESLQTELDRAQLEIDELRDRIAELEGAP